MGPLKTARRSTKDLKVAVSGYRIEKKNIIVKPKASSLHYKNLIQINYIYLCLGCEEAHLLVGGTPSPQIINVKAVDIIFL